MINAQPPSVKISSFQALAAHNSDKTIVSKSGELKSTPANQGFFGRLLNFIKSGSSGKVNAETRADFNRAMHTAFGRHIALTVMKNHGFEGNSGKPLMGREITKMVGAAAMAATEMAQKVKEKKAEIDAIKKEMSEARLAQTHMRILQGSPGVNADGGVYSYRDEKNRSMEELRAVVEKGADAEARLAAVKDELNKLRGVY